MGNVGIYVIGAKGQMEEGPGSRNVLRWVWRLARLAGEQLHIIAVANVQQGNSSGPIPPLMPQRKAQAFSIERQRTVKITGTESDVVKSCAAQSLVRRRE